MNDELISVIVPIYNVEPYLNKCIESITNQTYKNLEIILVDDGSPDNCPMICDEWAKKDNRIIVIHKENGGLSDARNAGLDICKGDYICFIDSDDYIELTYVEKLYSAIKVNNADIAVCNYSQVNENYEVVKTSSMHEQVYSNENRFDFLFASNGILPIIACNKLYARHIFETLRYPKGKIHEDEFVAYDVICNSKKSIVVISDALYNYLTRSNSITGNKKPNSKSLHIIEALKLRLQKIDLSSRYYSAAVQQYLSMFSCLYKRVKADKSLKKQVYSTFKQEYKVYGKYIKKLKTKIKCVLFKFLPNLFNFI